MSGTVEEGDERRRGRPLGGGVIVGSGVCPGKQQGHQPE
jgi:hypothetical protein